MAEENTLVSISDVSVKFGREIVLQNLCAEIRRHEVFTIIGPSGAGKTVLLKTIAGLIRPDEGSATFEGIELARLTLRTRKEYSRKIAMSFQRSGLFDSLSSAENLRFPMRESGNYLQQEIEDRVKRVLSEVGLEQFENFYPHEMSGGMQKRLGIARALVLQPSLVLYDDPTAGLDPVTARTITELLIEMKQKYAMTVVLVTSDLNLAYAVSERIGFLHHGQLLQIGSVDEIRHSSHPMVNQFVRGLLEGPLA